MNNIIKRTWNQNRMTNIEDLSGMAFQAEAQGHTFEISGINDAGNAVTLTGTVSGVFMRPNGSAVPLTGSISNGKALLTLDADCYAIAGRFVLTMFLASGTQNTAIYAAVGSIMRSTGDTPYVAPAYTLLASAEFTVATTSTSQETIGEINISPASELWRSDAIILVSVRDKAGKRNGYFLGCDYYFSNPIPANDGAATSLTYAGIAKVLYNVTDAGDYDQANQPYGVYPYDINNSGRVRIYARYNSSYSLTINGTYKVDVYALKFPNNVSPFGGNS